jgi:thioredoxin 1
MVLQRLTGVLLLLTFAVGWVQSARAADPQPAPILEATYMGLSMGPLRNAQLVVLPAGTVLRAGAVTITESQVTAEIGKAPSSLQAALKKNRVIVIEQLATRSLLLAEARAWAAVTKRDTNGESEGALLSAYLHSLADAATVTDTELRAFYAANTDMVEGAAFETVEKDLKAYLLDEQRQQIVDTHVNTLSERTLVQLDAAWVKAQAVTALDNPVDRARRAGKPALVDFGADGCRPCEMMTPILDELQKTYAGQCTIMFVHVRQQEILAARYGISSIPVQVFFDKEGKEVFRHVGFFPRAQILEQLAKLGVR